VVDACWNVLNIIKRICRDVSIEISMYRFALIDWC